MGVGVPPPPDESPQVMLSNYFFLILSIAILVGFGFRAFHHGGVSMLWGVIGAVSGLVGGFLLYRTVLGDLEMTKAPKLALAFLGGLFIYLIVRALVKALLDNLFEPDGALQWFSDGYGGALLSLIPSLLTIAVIAGGLRIGGTLSELRRYEFLATPNRHVATGRYPDQPLATGWRNGMEDLPMISTTLDSFGLFGKPAERQLVGLLIITKKPALKSHLEENLESKPIFESEAFQSLVENEEVQALNQAGDRLALLQDAEVQTAAADAELGPRLEELELSRLVDAFLLSPEWQAVVESYRRDSRDRDREPEPSPDPQP